MLLWGYPISIPYAKIYMVSGHEFPDNQLSYPFAILDEHKWGIIRRIIWRLLKPGIEKCHLTPTGVTLPDYRNLKIIFARYGRQERRSKFIFSPLCSSFNTAVGLPYLDSIY